MHANRHRIVIPTILAFLLVSMPFATPAVSAAEVVAAAVGSADLRAVTFVSATTGYAAADNGAIFKTTNGGDSWTQVRAADSYSFRGIDFWDASNLVAVDQAGKVASSTDGGSTWTNVNFTPNIDMDPPSTALTHNDVATKRGTNDALVAAGDEAPYDDTWIGASSMRTTSSLAYWRNPLAATEPHDYYNEGIESWDTAGKGEFLDVEYIAGTTTVWASGIDYWTLDASNLEKYPLFKSTDEGASWTKITGFGTADLRLEGVAFGSSTAGIIVGQVVGGDRVARYTTNGGTTWTPSATLPGTTALNAVDMSSASNGWAVGADGGILRTTNGGADWTACTITGGNAYPLYDVTFVPGTTTGWAVGAAGTVLLTTDGVTWRAPGPVVNQPPAAVADSYTTSEDIPKVVAAAGVLANDTDAESNPLTAIKVSEPGHGTVTLNSNGSFTYTPSANWSGTDSFTYMANDGTSNSNVATVTITVNAVNDAPVAVADAYTTPENTPKVVPAAGVLANDTDAESNPLTAIKVSEPGHGTVTLNSNGSFTYTPAAGYLGTDNFTYKANDATSDSNVVAVTITVGAAVTPVPVYRFYRPSTGTHFYTADAVEMQRVRDTMAATYSFEGTGYTINSSNPANSVALYRLYNRRTGTHLYTADVGELNTILATLSAIYSLDGEAYKVSMTTGSEVHRFYSPAKGVHFYSSDPAEIDYVRTNLASIWKYEGPAYKVAQ